jgi:hypothetical protein
MPRKIPFLIALVVTTNSLFGQLISNGVLTGSFENNSIYYRTDTKINALAPPDRIGSNSYFKFDYKVGKFTAGIQYEAYLPPLVGYSQFLEGNEITSRYASYTDSLYSLTVGNFYEQFGSGLIFRSYEERALGINNSLDGVLLKFQPLSGVRVKTLWGKQRKFLKTGDGTIRGFDAEIDILSFLSVQNSWNFVVGGSWLNKYQQYTGPSTSIPSTVNSFAGRLQIERANYSLFAEVVSKGKDPQLVNLFSQEKGNAILVQQSITAKGFGAVLSVRRLENIDSRSERDAHGPTSTVNYLPALSKQHKYALANIHPYSAQAKGEFGGQLDVFYSFPRNISNTLLKGVKVNLNFSRYNSLSNYTTNFISVTDTLLFSDFTFEVQKKFSPGFKLNLSYINQVYNKGEVEGGDKVIASQIGVLETLVRITDNIWLKTEVSELIPSKNENYWTYLLAEISFAPKWTFMAADMIDHADQAIHYYNFGMSFTQKATRFSVNWGRNREGLQCAGGLCRYVPAYSGFGLSVITTF